MANFTPGSDGRAGHNFSVDDLRCSGRHRTDFRIRQMFRLVGNLTVDTYAEGRLGMANGPSARQWSLTVAALSSNNPRK